MVPTSHFSNGPSSAYTTHLVYGSNHCFLLGKQHLSVFQAILSARTVGEYSKIMSHHPHPPRLWTNKNSHNFWPNYTLEFLDTWTREPWMLASIHQVILLGFRALRLGGACTGSSNDIYIYNAHLFDSFFYPICSKYGIFTYSSPKFTVNVGKYSASKPFPSFYSLVGCESSPAAMIASHRFPSLAAWIFWVKLGFTNLGGLEPQLPIINIGTRWAPTSFK